MLSKSRKMAKPLLLLLVLVSAAWLSATPFYPAPPSIVHGPFLLDDAEGALRLDEVLRRAGEYSAAPVRGYWWVAEAVNAGDDERWVVHVGNTAIDRARLFVYDGGEEVHRDSADMRALAHSGAADYVIGHHFPFEFPSGSRRILVLHLDTAVAHPGLIFVKPQALAGAESRFYMLAIWTGVGAMAALICYNLFLGLSLRLSTYLFYVTHASGHLLYLLTALGLLGTTLPVMERYLLLNIPSIGLGVLGGALFVYYFLELPSFAPRLARVYRFFIGALLLSPLLLLVLAPHTFFGVIRASHLLLAGLVVGAAVLGVMRHKPEARYILIGWGGMLALTTKGMLGVMGVTELTIDAGIWGVWAILFEMFFLSLALADRVRRLSREKDAAQAATAAKSTFLANMSHEIRTPLNGVLGMVEVLRGTPLDNQQREYLAHIRHSGNALLSLLDDILDYSRVEAGRIKLEQTDFDPRRLFDELMFLLSTQAENKGIGLALTVDPQMPAMLRGDPGRLRQVLLNLLGNAVKFTAQGEVRLTVECLARQGGENRLRFAVSDSGIGMDQHTQQHLFDRFEQADSSIARRYGGSGLGLAIVYELVRLMGGSVQVESKLGRGSRFEVELTLPDGQPAPVAEEEADVVLPPLHVLVVDDDAINRVVASALLTRDGHRVTTVDNGTAALMRITQEPFDLVLMDLGMPGMDGMETTRRLRASGATLPVIGLTAHVLPEQQRACIQSGMNAVLHKPVQAAKLNKVLAAVLQETHGGPSVAPALS